MRIYVTQSWEILKNLSNEAGYIECKTMRNASVWVMSRIWDIKNAARARLERFVYS